MNIARVVRQPCWSNATAPRNAGSEGFYSRWHIRLSHFATEPLQRPIIILTVFLGCSTLCRPCQSYAGLVDVIFWNIGSEHFFQRIEPLKSLPIGLLFIGISVSHMATATNSAGQAQLPPEQIILLSNSQVLRGNVTLYGDRYLITRSRSELRIPVKQVERICHDLDEAYIHLNKKACSGSAMDHLLLAQWCLDEGLRNCAHTQLDLAIKKQPDHPRIPLIRRQLHSRNLQENNVQARMAQPTVSPKDLEALVHDMPEGTVESFTRTVQPLLMNSCSARACHGSAGANDFLLHRFTRKQSIPRRGTLRNLHAVMKWIDRERPTDSTLLHYATTAHGTKTNPASRNPPLASHGIPFKRLSGWIAQFGNGDLPANNVPVATQSLAARTPFTSDAGSVKSPSLYNRSREQQNEKIGRRSNKPSYSPQKRPHFLPKDSFDPEIFNRRHHPSQEGQAEK